MRQLPLLVSALLALTGAVRNLPAQVVPPSPESVLGFQPGADRKLADWAQITGYFSRLAAASPAVRLDTLGPTGFGRPMVLATISTPENIRNLDAIRNVQRRLSDPRGLAPAEAARLIAGQPAVLVITCNIHSTEIASSQMAMTLAYRLATNDTLQRALQNVVVLLLPSVNPDGEQMVTEWYRSTLGTPWEGSSPPYLYNKYVGHDNNRDWYMITQPETRLVTDLLYRKWFPEVVYDVHQQGSEGSRMAVPPYVDPINPNIDPLLVREVGQIGAEMALALEERGKSGVANSVTYDMWWHGGLRSTPMRHNMVGILTEAASARLATPITQDSSELEGHPRGLPRYEQRMNFPNPWPGGSWRLADIVDYELISAESLVQLMARQRADYVRNFVGLAERQIALGKTQAPYGYRLPFAQRDQGALAELVRVLQAGGVEVRADSSAYVVDFAQPYRAHAKDLLEVQRFPKLEQWPGGPAERPYDVAGWTLPLQMGVRAAEMDDPLARALPLVGDSGAPARRGSGGASCELAGNRPLALDPRDTRSYGVVMRALVTGVPVRVAPGPVRDAAGTARWPSGAFVLAGGARTTAVARGAVVSNCASVRSLPSGRSIERMPRVALYRPWTANMNEGWTRWLLDRFGMPVRNVSDSAVRAGALREGTDVLIVPAMSLRQMRTGNSASAVPPRYAGGLGEAGLSAIGSFVRAGGTLVLFDQGSELATATLGVPATLVRSGRARPADDSASRPIAPGSVLRVLVDTTSAVAFGMPDTAAVYFINSVAYDVRAGAPVRVLARYPARGSDILLSGYLEGAEQLAGRAAAVEAAVGRGRVVMFGFRPQYRGQSWGTFRLLFNALLGG